jgi:hypothetical protein
MQIILLGMHYKKAIFMTMATIDDQGTDSPNGRISTSCNQHMHTHSFTQHLYHLNVKSEYLIFAHMSFWTFAPLCSLQV